MSDGAKFVLHHTSVVPTVRGHHTLHDQAPMLMSQLWTKFMQIRSSLFQIIPCTNSSIQCLLKCFNFMTSYLDSSNSVLSSEFSAILQPADWGRWTSCSRTPKFNCVSSWDSIKLFLHPLNVGPIWDWRRSGIRRPNFNRFFWRKFFKLQLIQYTPLEM